jgi:hypothetical protein
MWVIAVLLLIFFALLVFSKTAKTRKMNFVFLCLAMAVYIVVAFLLTWKDDYNWDYSFNAVMGFVFLSMAISDLIAVPISRRRGIPPCVRVKRHQSGIYNIAMALMLIAFVIFLITTESFRSLPSILWSGPMTVTIIIWLILVVSEKIKICANGLCQSGRFQPWDEYESFCWKWETKDSLELRLVSKPGLWICSTTRLIVPPEDREAVNQLLEANLPNLSA